MVNELEYLRKCIRCGKTAKTKEDLDQFAVAIKNKYGRRNICKKCYVKEANEYRLRRWESQGKKLEDAQKEIEEKSEGYAKVCARLHEHIIDLEKEHSELKQKLHNLLSFVERRPSCYGLLGDHRYIDEWFESLKMKVEELLKEKKEAK